MCGYSYIPPTGIPEPIGEKHMARKWTTIKIPHEVLPLIQSLRARTGKASWQILVEALSFYESSLRSSKHFSSASDVDKLAYYILKIVTSATYYKTEPSKESLEKFRKVVEQIEKRTGTNCSELVPAAEKLIRNNSGRNIHTFNMSLKTCIIRLIEKMITG